MLDFEAGHRLLIRSLKKQGITDERVLSAMSKVLRHHFVPSPFQELAYTLRPLPIGHGQTISSPFIVASMSELLRLKGNERVLEIGTGCGYQTAILCELAAEVYSIEIIDSIAQLGQKNLNSLEYCPELKIGDGSLGWQSAAPFDAILIAATAPRIPEPIVDQLKTGGVLVLPIEQGLNETLMRCTKTVHGYETEELYDVRFVPMTGKIRSGKHEQT